MLRTLDVEEMAQRNPDVDLGRLKKSMAISSRLESRKSNRKGYELDLPYSGKARAFPSGEIRIHFVIEEEEERE